MTQEQDKERAQPVARGWQVEALLDGKWVPQWPVDATREAAEKSMAFFEQKVEFRVVPLYAAPQPNAALADGWLNPEDMAALQRADECFEDGEGHDLLKAQMDRLIELGVMRHNGGGYYSITAFGNFVLGSEYARKPLETIEECNARLDREHRAKLGMPAPTPNAALADEWVSVDERLPEKNTEVLIAFSKSTLPATGQYTGSARDNNGWCYPGENDPDEVGGVTHWRPLPAPPTLNASKEG